MLVSKLFIFFVNIIYIFMKIFSKCRWPYVCRTSGTSVRVVLDPESNRFVKRRVPDSSLVLDGDFSCCHPAVLLENGIEPPILPPASLNSLEASQYSSVLVDQVDSLDKFSDVSRETKSDSFSDAPRETKTDSSES